MAALTSTPASSDGASSGGEYEDMVLMDNLTPDTILDNVSRRYQKDSIYTNVSSILIAVNPYHALPQLYNTAALHRYHFVPASLTTPPPPHIYALAHAAYLRALGRYSSLPPHSQSILISGESGAGKTETTKHILTYLAHASASSASQPSARPSTASSSTLSSAFSQQLAASVSASIESRLLQCNPILEAWGNAKTLRNNNSSRFGKWIDIAIDARTGHIAHASVRHYLLETNRVIGQGSGERNYNIFYQLAAKLRRKATEFRYLSGSGCDAIEGVNDREMYDTTTHALSVLGMPADSIQQVLDITLAILHLGNVTFTPGAPQAGKDSCVVEAGKGEAALQEAARLLTLRDAQLRAVLLTKVIVSPRSTIINSPRSVAEAEQTRDTLARTLYAALMSYLVDRINDALNPNPASSSPASAPPTVSIGILDIFGFECFPVNSLEQLLINYANERLHQHFLSYVFKLELQLYQSEGLLSAANSPFAFTDNASTVELLDKRPAGLFPLLTDEVYVPKGNDASLLQKMNAAHAAHSQYIRPKPSRGSTVVGMDSGPDGRFGVAHYAGSVEYGVRGMVDKNRSKVSDQLLILFEGARGDVMRRMFGVEEDDDENRPPAPTAAAAATAKGEGAKGATPRPSVAAARATVCSLFQQSLSELLASIAATHSHFVRCIKPNADKLSYSVDAPLLRTQLQSSGVMDAVRVRKEGWGERMPLRDFVQRYQRLAVKQLNERGMQRAPDADKADVIIAVARSSQPALQSQQTNGLYALGKTKLFYKSSLHSALEAMLGQHRVAAAVLLQKRVRGWLVRRRQQAMKQIWKSLKAALQKGDLAQVDSLLPQLSAMASAVPASLLSSVQQQRNQLSAGNKASTALLQSLTLPLSSVHARLQLLDTALAMAAKVPAPQYATWFPTLAKSREVGAEVRAVLVQLQAGLEAIKRKLLVDATSTEQLSELLKRSSSAIAASTARLPSTAQSPISLTSTTDVSAVQSLAVKLRRVADQLTAAINTRDLPALHAALEEADTVGLQWPVLQEGRMCHQAQSVAGDVDAALEEWTEQSIINITSTLTALLASTSTPALPSSSSLNRFLPAGVSLSSLIGLLEASLVAVQSELEAETAAQRALTQRDHFKLTMAIQRAEDALYMKEHSRRTVTGRPIQTNSTPTLPKPTQSAAPPVPAARSTANGNKPGGTMGRNLEALVAEMRKECSKLEQLHNDTKAREERQQAAVEALRAAHSSSSPNTIQQAIALGEEAQVGKELLDGARSHLLTVETTAMLTAAIDARDVPELKRAIDVSSSRLKSQALDVRSRAYHDTHQHAQAVLNMLLAVDKVRAREVEASRTRYELDKRRRQRAAAGVEGGPEAQRDEAAWAAVVEGLREAVAASRLHGAKDADIPAALQYVHEWDALHPKQKDEAELAEERERAAQEEQKEQDKQRIIDRLRPQLNGGVRVMLPMPALPRRPSEVAAAAATPQKRASESDNEPGAASGGGGVATPQSSEGARRAAELVERKRRADERRARLLREEAQLQEDEAARQQQRAMPPKPTSPRVRAAPSGRSVPPSPSPPTAHTRVGGHHALPSLPSLDRVSVMDDDGSRMGSRRVSDSTGQILPLVGSSSAGPSVRGSMDISAEVGAIRRSAQDYEWPPKAKSANGSQASSPQHTLGRSLGDMMHDEEQPGASAVELQEPGANGELPADGSVTVKKDSSCCCVIS